MYIHVFSYQSSFFIQFRWFIRKKLCFRYSSFFKLLLNHFFSSGWYIWSVQAAKSTRNSKAFQRYRSLWNSPNAHNRKDTKSLLCAINGKKVKKNFDENYGRSADHKYIEYKNAVTAICVNDKFVTIGFYNGLVEILSSQEHKVLIFFTFVFNFNNMFYSYGWEFTLATGWKPS